LKEGIKVAITSNEPLSQVLGNYPFKVLDIRNESYKDKKGVWWIKTSEGMRILKKISNSEETLKFILHAVNHLQNNGIRLPKVFKTSDGSNYTVINGTCYVLTEAIEGKNPSYTSPRELNSLVCELAKFHKASEGFSIPAESKPKYHLGLWIEDYKAQLEEINAYYKNELLLKDHDAIGKTLMKEFPYFYERARKAIDGLSGTEYSEWVAKAIRTGCLCHQDFAAGNLIMNASDSIYVIDTDSITVDIAARDIRKLLNKVMKKAGRWDTELTRTILNSYQSKNPLTPSQWRVVMLDLMFPHLFLGAVNKYIYKRDKEWSAEKYHQRMIEMAAFEKTLPPVLEHFESIMPK
jgi:CotS family spore coat protein